MAKLSRLPDLLAPDGTERLPVVHRGVTKGTPVGPLVTAAVMRNFPAELADGGQVLTFNGWDPDGEIIRLGDYTPAPGARSRLLLPSADNDTLAMQSAFDEEIVYGRQTRAFYGRDPETGMFAPISRPLDVLHLDRFTDVYLGGASATKFTAALIAAIEFARDINGGVIRIPIRPDTLGYLIDMPLWVGSNIRFEAVGGQAIMRPATHFDEDLITLDGTNNSLAGFWLTDPQRLVSGAIVAISGNNRSDYGTEVSDVVIYDANCAVRNDGATPYLRRIFTNGCTFGFLNTRGGVNGRITECKSIGDKYGYTITGISQAIYPGDPPVDHPEGFDLNTVWAARTQPGGAAFTIGDIVWLRATYCQAVELDDGADGMVLNGTDKVGAGPSLVDLSQCYFEGGANGAALKAHANPGTIDQLNATGLKLGSAGRTNVAALDFDGVANFQIQASCFYSNGPVKMSRSVGEFLPGSDFRSATRLVGDTNIVRWGIKPEYFPADMPREGSCEYPLAWTDYVPVSSAATGEIASFGLLKGRFKRDGKTVSVQFQVQIIDPGTGGGYLQIGLPYPAGGFVKARPAGWDENANPVPGADDALQGSISETTGTNILSVWRADRSTAIAAGTVASFEFQYESL